MLDQDSLPVVLICEENIIRQLPRLVTQRIVFSYVSTTAVLFPFTMCKMQTTVFLCTFTGTVFKVISGANWMFSYFSSRRVRRERRGWRRSSRLTRRSTWRKATCRETWIKWWAFVSLRVHEAGVFWCRFNLFVFVCVSDYSGRAAHGADLQPGVSPQTEGKLPPETQRSAPQQRLATDSGPRQPGCTQRWVRRAWAFMRVVLRSIEKILLVGRSATETTRFALVNLQRASLIWDFVVFFQQSCAWWEITLFFLSFSSQIW